MSEMIERVARAIDQASQPPGQRDYKILMENCARAAISAMREPTKDMIDATDDLPVIIGDEGPPPDRAWRAMIEAALSPPLAAGEASAVRGDRTGADEQKAGR